MEKRILFKFVVFILFLFSVYLLNADTKNSLLIKDSTGRAVVVPQSVKTVICSGSGCLRLITYMQAQHLVVGVDSIEKKENAFESRPYKIANPQLNKLPLFGEFRGLDNPELILTLNPLPDLIFKVFSTSGHDADELQDKTGIPVVVLKYGDLSYHQDDLFNSLRIIGNILNKDKRAEEVISFITASIDELNNRTVMIPASQKKKCFIGGVAQAGSHGFNSTEPAYSPFKMVNAVNTAFDPLKNPLELAHAYIAKEKIVEWDPDVLFIDLSTLQIPQKGNALYEIKNDPVYRELTAVKKGEVYSLLPYNFYSVNFESIMVNAYYIGKLLYPEQFKDITIEKKADEIFTFFVNAPVYQQLNINFSGLIFKKLIKE